MSPRELRFSITTMRSLSLLLTSSALRYFRWQKRLLWSGARKFPMGPAAPPIAVQIAPNQRSAFRQRRSVRRQGARQAAPSKTRRALPMVKPSLTATSHSRTKATSTMRALQILLLALQSTLGARSRVVVLAYVTVQSSNARPGPHPSPYDQEALTASLRMTKPRALVRATMCHRHQK